MSAPRKITVLRPVGRCIYGEEHTGPFSDEHIIALGLGGSIILPAASCRDCARITAGFEQTCLRAMMGPLRIRLNLPTRRPKERPRELRTDIFDAEGNLKTVTVPATQFPLTFIGLKLPAPAFLRGAAPSSQFEGEFWVKTNQEEIAKHVKSGERLKVGRINPGAFSRMLAKIAHARAVAEWGLDNFRPLLLDVILGRSDAFFYYVGGEMTIPPAETGGLHKHQPMHTEHNGVRYVGMTVRLFCQAGTPVYHIIVGEALAELRRTLELAA